MPESSDSPSHSHRDSDCREIKHIGLIRAAWSFISMKDQAAPCTRVVDSSPPMLKGTKLTSSPSDKVCAPIYICKLSIETYVDLVPYAFTCTLYPNSTHSQKRTCPIPCDSNLRAICPHTCFSSLRNDGGGIFVATYLSIGQDCWVPDTAKQDNPPEIFFSFRSSRLHTVRLTYFFTYH